MNLFGWNLSMERKAGTISLDTLIRRLEATYQTSSGVGVTPENCMQSPTVHAIVGGMSKAIASLPIKVYQKGESNGRAIKEELPNHSVARLLKYPNGWQTSVDYWQDATSTLLRYGRYAAFIRRGNTGPIRELLPLPVHGVTLKQDSNFDVEVEVIQADGAPKRFPFNQIHYARGPARDFLKGDSPVDDVREAIALEIAAEKFGATFFGGGAMPGIVFKFMEGFQAFKTDEEKRNFIEGFQSQFTKGRFRAMLMPKGMEMDKAVGIENDKAQFLETRRYQRTVIAGAFGIPPYMVGDLERQTFNNAEQQNINKVIEAVLPVCRAFESAMERDLLTDADRAGGVIIRFNVDGLLRGDFLTRMNGYKIGREMGTLSPNDIREMENQNPISEEDGGESYWQQGPSGQGQQQQPQQMPRKPKPTEGNDDGE